MNRLESIYLHVTFAAVAITGSVFAFMKYLMTTDDPFAVANHPWQPYMLDVHVVFAPLLAFGLGLIFSNHVLPGLRSGNAPGRNSGFVAILTVAPMILSGYLMQVITHEQLQFAMRVTHWITSGVFTLAYLGHQLPRRATEALASGAAALIRTLVSRS
jgi:hypothetical protein